MGHPVFVFIQAVCIIQTVQFPDRATRSGYTFAGWKINGEGETRTGLLGQDLPGGNVKLVAQWTPISYTVRFFVDDVQQGGTLSVRCGEKIPAGSRFCPRCGAQLPPRSEKQ